MSEAACGCRRFEHLRHDGKVVTVAFSARRLPGMQAPTLRHGVRRGESSAHAFQSRRAQSDTAPVLQHGGGLAICRRTVGRVSLEPFHGV